MAHVRCVARLHSKTGNPDDVYVNTTYWFNATQSLEQMAPLVDAAVGAFYGAVQASGKSVASYMATSIATDWETRIYDMADPEPRVPVITTHTGAQWGAGSTANLPEEVAVCLSFHAAPPLTAWRRGRIFIGPLNALAGNSSQTTLTRVSPTFLLTLTEAAQAMHVNPNAFWEVYSPTYQVYAMVDGGFANDAFDTQRRRGAEEFTREVFGNAQRSARTAVELQEPPTDELQQSEPWSAENGWGRVASWRGGTPDTSVVLP